VGEIRVAATREVPVPAPAVSRSVADYREHHRFQPPASGGWVVEAGGAGAGTAVRFTSAVGGRTRDSTGRGSPSRRRAGS
jgi:hypothetical protein